MAAKQREYFVGYRIWVLLAGGDRVEPRIPRAVTGQVAETAHDALLDDRAHLASGAVGATFAPRTARLEKGAVACDLVDQLGDAARVAIGGDCLLDRDAPGASLR